MASDGLYNDLSSSNWQACSGSLANDHWIKFEIKLSGIGTRKSKPSSLLEKKWIMSVKYKLYKFNTI